VRGKHFTTVTFMIQSNGPWGRISCE